MNQTRKKNKDSHTIWMAVLEEIRAVVP